MPFRPDSNAVSSDKIPLQTIVASAIVFLTTFGALFYMCLQVKEKSNTAVSANFRMLADERISRVQNRFRSELARVTSTKRFIENSDITTESEFNGFTLPFRQAYGNYILARFIDTETIDKKRQAIHQSSPFNYQTYSSPRNKEPADQRKSISLTVIFSTAPNSEYRPGFDLNSNESLFNSFRRARETGTTTVSSPTDLEPGKYQAFFISPIGCVSKSCEKNAAFVASIVPFSELMEADIPASSSGQMAIGLTFIGSNGVSSTVYTNGIPPAKQEGLIQTKTLVMDGFQYVMTVAASDAFLLSQGEEFKSSYLIALSIIVSSLLSLMFFLLANQNRKTSYLVLKKTHELDVINRTDFLTGIYNRRHFNETMESLTNAIHPIFIKHGIVAFDVDHFKSINDTFGHDKGDEILSELTTLISNNLRTKDVFCRTGGEEFSIVCPDTSITGCMVLGEKLRQAVESHDFPIKRKVTISLGITEFSYGQPISSITKKADQALYAAKAAGRNRIEVSM